jgi:DNA-directed RNA polymerase, mitochondrial
MRRERPEETDVDPYIRKGKGDFAEEHAIVSFRKPYAALDRSAARQEQTWKGYSSTDEAHGLYNAYASRLVAHLEDALRMRKGDSLRPIKRALKTLDVYALALATMGYLVNAIDTVDREKKSAAIDVIMSVGNGTKRFALSVKRKRDGTPRKGGPTQGQVGLFKVWRRDDVAVAGNFLIDCCLQSLPDVFVLVADVPCITEEALDHAREFIRIPPVYWPQRERPEPWASWRQGERTLVRSDRAEGLVRRAIADGSIQPALDGLNALQSVEWIVNPQVVDEVRIADHVVERAPGERPDRFEARKRQVRLRAMIAAATGFTLWRFYLPMSLEWRGRVYADPHFAYSREDTVRGMFRFAKGAPIGDGLRSLKIHIANVGDFRLPDGRRVGKLSYADRIAWVDQHIEEVLAVRNWQEAADPYRYLAACRELAGLAQSQALTTLPISFDATASGIQHLCALIRSEEGDKVNLTPALEPRDLYAAVAERVLSALKASTDPRAAICISLGIDRALVKRPVMTYGYSVSPIGIAGQLREELRDRKIFANYKDVWHLAGVILKCTEDEISGPAKVKEFLREIASRLCKIGKPLIWASPVGIPIIIDYRKPRYKQMTLPQLGINHFRKIGVEYTPELDARGMRDGIVPNVVHACDASLVLMTASACAAEGIELATVHDCFSCLAPHARRMNVIVREQFVKLYTEHDVLAEIYEAAERAGAKNLPTPPERGTLDLNAVKRANYFLS